MSSNLNRFIDAQKIDYITAYSEIKAGKKNSHWMWYIFPQIIGLACSQTSKFYGIENLNEAKDFLNNEYLSNNLFNITKLLHNLDENNASKIFGFPDDLKLKSSMTLFYIASNNNPIYKFIIDKYFNGDYCENTLKLLRK